MKGKFAVERHRKYYLNLVKMNRESWKCVESIRDRSRFLPASPLRVKPKKSLTLRVRLFFVLRLKTKS